MHLQILCRYGLELPVRSWTVQGFQDIEIEIETRAPVPERSQNESEGADACHAHRPQKSRAIDRTEESSLTCLLLSAVSRPVTPVGPEPLVD